MKRILIVLLLILSCGVQQQTIAQAKTDQRAFNTKIADLLMLFPAKDQAALNANMETMASLGEKGLLEMATMLAPSGKGDNTQLQYAIGGFSFYVMQPGKSELRTWVVKAYCAALNKITDKENKAFIITQLQRTGKDDAVACLTAYLSDDRLVDPAARALVKVNTPAANKALLQALSTATGSTRITLVEALGDVRYSEAAAAILPLATNDDKKLVKVASFALASIGDASAATVLGNAAAKSNYTYDVTDATSNYLLYISQLIANGNTTLASKLAGALVKQCTQDTQAHTRAAALKLLVQIEGDKSVSLLTTAAADKNNTYREAALKFAAPYVANNVAPWLKALAKGNSATKAGIVTMLGNNGVKAALPAILKLLQSKDADVKLAAITAAGQIGQQEVLPALLPILKNGNATELATVKSAILTMKGDDVATQVGNALPGMPSAAQVTLIEILAARKADSGIGNVLPLAQGQDETVRKTALGALKNLVTSSNLSSLFALLGSATQPDDIANLQSAVVAATNGSTPEQRAAAVLAQMKQAPADQQYRFFDILAGIGGKDALKIVAEGFDKGNAQSKEAAVKALSQWADDGAAQALLNISRNAGNSAYLDQALQGYIKLTAKSGVNAEQKFLMLREAMDVAKTPEQQKVIMKAVEKCKTLPALFFAGTYLDNAAVQQEAAIAVMNIAASDKGFTGSKVRSLLEKTIQVLKGQDSEYQKVGIRKLLAEMPAGEGFVSMFNGKDLTGWKGLVADPLKRAKMDAKTLAAEQKKADEEMRNGWSAKDGLLVFGGKGNNLCTEKQYSDFEMYVDWKITKDGDAGIYLRGTPQVQIWDIARVDVGAQVGSGGLYNNQTNESKPSKLADNPVGEWNNFRIIMKGDRVTVYLNGEMVVDNIILENFWDRKLPIFIKEQIELQAHGTYVAYRDLYIREIPTIQPFVLSEQEKKEGYQVLFDGTNMHQWTGNTKDYIIEDGAIAIYPLGGNGGNLYTKDEYSDFTFRFEFQLTPGANNGLGVRAPLNGDAAYEGMEIQILDNEADIYKNLNVYQYHGSVYGILPAKRGFLKPVGEWNYEEVTMKGSKVKVTLNGTVILDGDLAEARKNGALDGKKHPGVLRDKGHFGFLGHGSVVKFKNIRVKDLTAKK
jgi:HEAT repeat protein